MSEADLGLLEYPETAPSLARDAGVALRCDLTDELGDCAGYYCATGEELPAFAQAQISYLLRGALIRVDICADDWCINRELADLLYLADRLLDNGVRVIAEITLHLRPALARRVA